MDTYKAVMRPALDYAYSIWSPLTSFTSIDKLQVMQNASLRTVTRCTLDTNIQHLHDETLILPIHEHLQFHASQYKQKTQHPSHPLHKHAPYFNTPNKHAPLYMHLWFSGHLATRGNNKILHTLPPLINSYEEILPGLARRTLANSEHIHHPSSNHTYTKSMQNHIHHHYASSVTRTHTTHILSSTAPTYAPHCPHRRDGTADLMDGTTDLMDGEAGWWSISGMISHLH